MRVDKSKWEHTTLEKCIFSLRTGLNPRQNFVLNEVGATNYYITVRELNGRGITITDKTDKFCDYAFPLINHRSNLEPGDVLFSGTGSIGRTALITEQPKNWNIKEGVYVLKPNQQILDSMFLLYYLHSEYLLNFCKQFAKGATIQSVPMAKLKKCIIKLPPINEQKGIAAELDAVQAMIDGYREQLADLDALTQSIFLDTFGDPKSNPKGWEVNTIATLFINRDSERVPVSSSQRDNVAKIYDYYGASGVIDKFDKFIFDEILLLIGEDGANLLTSVKPNAFIAKGKYWVNNHAHVLQPKNRMNIVFACYCFNLLDIKQYITGIAQPKLSQANLNKINLLVPPLSLQQQFAERVEAIESQKELLRQQIADAETLMAERMQYYFS